MLFNYSAFNNTKYNAYNNQQPKRELLPFLLNIHFLKILKIQALSFVGKGKLI